MLKKLLHLTVTIIIVTLSLFYAFKDVSLTEIVSALNSAHYIYLIPTVLIVIMSCLFRAIRWRYIIASIKDVKTVRLFSPLMIGLMGNMLPARAGEFIRAYLLGKKENISFSASFATIFIEKFFDLLFVLLLLILILFFRSDILSYGNTGLNYNLREYMINFAWISFIVCLFILLFSILLQHKNYLAINIVNACIKPLPNKWGENIIRFINSFTEGLNIIKDKRRLFAVTLFTLIIFLSFIFIYYLLYLSFDINTKLPVLISLVLMVLVVDIFIAVFPTPGFLGSFHAACVATLHGIFGIPKAIALSYGIVAWLILMGFTVVAGLFFVIIDNIHLGELSSRKEWINHKR